MELKLHPVGHVLQECLELFHKLYMRLFHCGSLAVYGQVQVFGEPL